MSVVIVTAETLLPEICRVVRGSAWKVGERLEENLSMKGFFEDLALFQTKQSRRGKIAVTRQAIKLWEKGAVPKRSGAMMFLQAYVNSKVGEVPTERESGLERVIEFIEQSIFFESGDSINSTNSPKSVGVDPTIIMAIQGLIRVSTRANQNENTAFFRGSSSGQMPDHSYYIMYRHSSNYSDILKSFIVIRKPEKGVRSMYIFNHFVWGGEDYERSHPVFRECEGFILKMEKAFYFVGYNYTVPVDKRREPVSYVKERTSAKWSPNGMGMMALEYDDIHANPGLFGGLTMTVAGMAQPIIARVAMLHVGTRQSLGRSLMDDQVSPGEIKQDQISADLEFTVQSLRETGCRRLSPLLEEYTTKPEWKSLYSKRLADRIAKMIDNTPAWEVSQRRRGKITGRGAIETFGTSRPRN